MARNKSKGRQKIEIKKIQNEANLQVTFSKRRYGLIKKANELCTLSGADIAFIGFSPGNKAYSFGNPCVDSVIRQYQTQTPNPQTWSPTEKLVQLHRQKNLDKILDDLEVLQGKLKSEQERGVALDQMQNAYWWDAPIENLNKEQVIRLKSALEQSREEVKNAFNDLVQQEIQKNPVLCNHIGNSCGYVPTFSDSGYSLGFSLKNAGSTSGSSSQPTFGIDFNISNGGAEFNFPKRA